MSCEWFAFSRPVHPAFALIFPLALRRSPRLLCSPRPCCVDFWSGRSPALGGGALPWLSRFGRVLVFPVLVAACSALTCPSIGFGRPSDVGCPTPHAATPPSCLVGSIGSISLSDPPSLAMASPPPDALIIVQHPEGGQVALLPDYRVARFRPPAPGVGVGAGHQAPEILDVATIPVIAAEMATRATVSQLQAAGPTFMAAAQKGGFKAGELALFMHAPEIDARIGEVVQKALAGHARVVSEHEAEARRASHDDLVRSFQERLSADAAERQRRDAASRASIIDELRSMVSSAIAAANHPSPPPPSSNTRRRPTSSRARADSDGDDQDTAWRSDNSDSDGDDSLTAAVAEARVRFAAGASAPASGAAVAAAAPSGAGVPAPPPSSYAGLSLDDVPNIFLQAKRSWSRWVALGVGWDRIATVQFTSAWDALIGPAPSDRDREVARSAVGVCRLLHAGTTPDRDVRDPIIREITYLAIAACERKEGGKKLAGNVVADMRASTMDPRLRKSIAVHKAVAARSRAAGVPGLPTTSEVEHAQARADTRLRPGGDGNPRKRGRPQTRADRGTPTKADGARSSSRRATSAGGGKPASGSGGSASGTGAAKGTGKGGK